MSFDGRCPVCGANDLKLEQYPEDFDCDDTLLSGVNQRAHTCGACQAHVALPEDQRFNARSLVEARKANSGMLTGNEISAFRRAFRITQELASRFFGGGQVAFSKYENDDVTQSTAMDRLLWLCMKNPQNLRLLGQRIAAELPPATQRAIGQACVVKPQPHITVYICTTQLSDPIETTNHFWDLYSNSRNWHLDIEDLLERSNQLATTPIWHTPPHKRVPVPALGLIPQYCND